MISALRSLFRRAPPHLRGRVPVECGVGAEIPDALAYASLNGEIVTHLPPWKAPPDAVGRACLATMPPMGVKSITTIPNGIAVRYENNEDGREAQAKDRGVWAPPGDATAMREWRIADQHAQHWPEDGTVIVRTYARVGMAVTLPAPAENARRYTQEESTW